MNAPDLDFARRSRPPNPWGLLLLVAGLLLAADAVFGLIAVEESMSEARQRLSAQSEQVNKLRKARSASQRLASNDESDQRIKTARSVVRAITEPWEPLFDTLESTQNETVALLSITPDRASKRIAITGEAKNYDALSSYLDRLNESGVMQRPQLLSHEIKAQYKQVVFSAMAEWNTKVQAQKSP